MLTVLCLRSTNYTFSAWAAFLRLTPLQVVHLHYPRAYPSPVAVHAGPLPSSQVSVPSPILPQVRLSIKIPSISLQGEALNPLTCIQEEPHGSLASR